MKKVITILVLIVFILSFASSAHAQITKDQYFARSFLSGNELEFYDERYDSFAAGNTKRSSNFGLSEKRAKQIVNYVWNDSPELFRESGVYTDKEAEELQKQVDAAAAEILSKIHEDMTVYEKVEFIYHWLALHMEFDNEANDDVNAGIENKNVVESQTIIGGLVNEKAVCGGIARSLQYLLYQINIPCYTVVGMHEGGLHGWNIIQIDGEWYNADLTEDLGYPGEVFLYNDNIFSGTHQPDPSLNPPLPACTSDKYMKPTPQPTPTPKPVQAEPIKANIPDEPENAAENFAKPDTNPAWFILPGIAVAVIVALLIRKKKNA